MPTLQDILKPRRDFERRAVGRTMINRGVLMHFAGQEGVQACIVQDVTNHGAGIRLNGLNIVPARAGPWRPGFPVEGDHGFRWMTTTCSGRWGPGQQGCGRA
jgi:hypothetical protein